jgi:signal transduction histidine kinase
MPNPGSDKELQVEIDRLQAALAEVRRSRRRVVEAEAADRRVIERALHDGVQQRLVALAVDLQHLAQVLDRDPGSAKGLLEEVVANLREALSDATTLAQMVYPPLLDARGLPSSLRSAAARAGVTVAVEVPAGADYSPEVTAAIYWSCADALASASPGSEARIGVRDEDGGVAFEVAFEVEVAGGLPVALADRLRDRIEALDGRLTVDDDGLGSLVQGWLPLSR